MFKFAFVACLCMFIACTDKTCPPPPPPPPPMESIFGTKWMLESATGLTAEQYKTLTPDQIPYFTIDTTGKFVGFGGCNRMSGGKVVVTGQEVAFGAIGMTRMACMAGAVDKTELAMSRAINNATNWKIDQGKLMLYQKEALQATFGK
jgi:heat shock protein HslJ